MPISSEPVLSETLEEQLTLLDRSQMLILLIIVSISLSYYTIGIQKSQIGCLLKHANAKACTDFPDTFPIRLLSSLLVLISLFYFYMMSDQELCRAQNSCIQMRSASYNHTASLLVLIAAIIRTVDLLVVWKEERNSPGSATKKFDKIKQN